jgi:hypothetical protein
MGSFAQWIAAFATSSAAVIALFKKHYGTGGGNPFEFTQSTQCTATNCRLHIGFNEPRQRTLSAKGTTSTCGL